MLRGRPSPRQARENRPSLTGVLFDCDGVLVDSEESVRGAWREWARRHELDFESVAPVLHGRRSVDVVRRVAPELDADAEAAWVEQLQAADEAVRGIPGAAALLRRLPRERFGIVTSGSPTLVGARLRAAGIPSPAVLVTSADVVRGKPDPEGYLLGARRLAVKPAQVLVVEDAPAGVEAARTAGMMVIGVATTHSRSDLVPADEVIDGLGELAAAVWRLDPGSPLAGAFRSLSSPRRP